MATLFLVEGPYEIPYYQGKAGRVILDDNVKAFWKQHGTIAGQRGCYVFGIRAGKGYTPGYVGKATKSFKQESFSSHKLMRYQQFLADYQKGTPVMFFVLAPAKKGAPNAKHIGELEDFLIQIAIAANPDLLNVKGTRQEEWGIKGVIRSGLGKPSSSAKEFIKFMSFGIRS